MDLFKSLVEAWDTQHQKLGPSTDARPGAKPWRAPVANLCAALGCKMRCWSPPLWAFPARWVPVVPTAHAQLLTWRRA